MSISLDPESGFDINLVNTESLTSFSVAPPLEGILHTERLTFKSSLLCGAGFVRGVAPNQFEPTARTSAVATMTTREVRMERKSIECEEEESKRGELL
eukprot:CAMPEP_0171606378 /NCGR_PEP_ID=MMETSP0990-20121206/7730_1 /TAXON_ID=483369 /ORGANISM="non described non described, Strain CCMP2098" /LENGTH=97 /DNA_ID=CAMNT_0012169209 /DNA_START=386 /DNA_END=679 /DNA_ORIENTATION=-